MICLKDIVKTYNKGKSNAYEALHGVSLEIADGEMTAIIGTSGAGKSTLLHILACIDGFERGTYLLDGVDASRLSEKRLAVLRNQKIGMVMQDFALVEEFSAGENVMLPLDFAPKNEKRPKKERKALVADALESVGMGEYMAKPVKNLSGGQKQRVAIARAIVNTPAILLADEPTGALDQENTKEIMKVFRALNEQGKTIVIVTHDRDVAGQCGRIVEISDGRIVTE